MPLKKYFIVLVIILVHAFSNITIALTSQERACALMFNSCEGKKSSSYCKQMRKFVKDLKYSCKKVKKKKVTKGLSCYDKQIDQEYNRGQPNWLSVSWDATNPKVFGYCVSPGRDTARQCANAECVKNGGKRCKLPCNRSTAERLRSCRLGVNTYIASSTYGRLGCGTRWIERGSHTVDSYIQRELNRCKVSTSKASKAENVNICEVMKVWK